MMRLRYLMLLSLVPILGIISNSPAAEFVVPNTHTTELVVHNFPGRQIDVTGIQPGMNSDEVKELLKSKYPTTNFDTAMGTVKLDYRGVNARLAEFESAYRVSTKEGELLIVSMSSPITSSKVIKIERSISYRDPLSAPEMDTIAEALIQKYGKPSGDRLPTDGPYETSRIMNWYLTESGEIPCPLTHKKTPACIPEKARAAGAKLEIHVMLMPHNGGTKVRDFSLQMKDFTNSEIDSQAIETAIKSEIDKSLATTKQDKLNL